MFRLFIYLLMIAIGYGVGVVADWSPWICAGISFFITFIIDIGGGEVLGDIADGISDIDFSDWGGGGDGGDWGGD